MKNEGQVKELATPVEPLEIGFGVQPGINLAQFPVIKSIFGDQASGSVRAASDFQSFQEAPENQRRLTIALGRDVVFPSNKPFLTKTNFISFRRVPELDETLAQMQDAQGLGALFALPSAGCYFQMPLGMWIALNTCDNLDVESFKSKLRDGVKDRGVDEKLFPKVLENWETRWAPFLAGMGAIEAI